jgi:hypothetical protein
MAAASLSNSRRRVGDGLLGSSTPRWSCPRGCSTGFPEQSAGASSTRFAAWKQRAVSCAETRRWASVVAALLALVVLGCSSESATGSRQAEVAEHGAQVMPFDLNATMHTFTKTGDGGVQSVTANDPGDTAQVELIRRHLRAEQASFSIGNFTDPARIHGMDMPGVSVLAAGYRSITVTYEDASAGARLVYVTSDPTLVDALHEWFDRQLMDHGDHARPG